MSKQVREVRGRALCRQTVREVLGNDTISNEERQAALLVIVNKAANEDDSDFGQLRATLSPVDECTDAYQSGVSAYVRTMAKTGNHPRALRAACRATCLKPPAEDRGPIDRLFDWLQRHDGQMPSRPRRFTIRRR